MSELENVNPLIFKKSGERQLKHSDYDDNVIDVIDEREVFGKFSKISIDYGLTKNCEINFSDLIRNINDPEHPLTLEELHVLEEGLVTVDDKKSEIFVRFTPTIPVSFLVFL